MKRPKGKQGRSKHGRDKFVRVKCKIDPEDNNERDRSSSDETDTGDCSDDSNGSDDTEVFCDACNRSRNKKKDSTSSMSADSSDSERSSKARHNSKKNYSLFLVAADRSDCESDSGSSDRTVGRSDKKKRKISNDGCGGGPRKKSKDSKKRGSVKIKKISPDSCEELVDTSSPLKILHRFICQGYEKSQMKGRGKTKEDCESLEHDSEDECERGRSRGEKKKKGGTRGSSVPAKECTNSRKEGGSKKKRSASYSNNTSGTRTSTKCCQTVSIDFSSQKNCKDGKKTRSKSCQTSKHDSTVYSLTEVRKPSVCFKPPNQQPHAPCFPAPNQNLPAQGLTDRSPVFSLPGPSQLNRQDTCVKDSQKPAGDRTVKTLELHVDLGGSHKKRHRCSKEKETTPAKSEENMKWFEKAFQDEFKNFVKKCEETKPEMPQPPPPTKGSPIKKCKSMSKSKAKTGGIEKEASIMLNAADLSKLANMMHQLSTEPNC